MADWIKLSTNLFDNPKIKIIRSYPDGDSLCLLWIAMIALAGSINDDGAIRVTDSVAYTSKTLGLTLGFDEAVVKAGLEAFQELGMIEIDEVGVIYLTGWGKHQNVSGLERIKEQTKERVRRHRDKKNSVAVTDGNADVTLQANSGNAQASNDVTQCNVTVTLPVTDGNADVTQQNKNKSKSIDNYDDDNNPISLNSLNGETYSKAIKSKSNNSSTVVVDSIANSNVVDLYSNNICPITPILAEKLTALIGEVGEAAVKYGIEAAVEQGVRTLPYVQTCARNYLASGGKAGKQRPRGKPKVNDVEGAIAQIKAEMDAGGEEWWTQ